MDLSSHFQQVENIDNKGRFASLMEEDLRFAQDVGEAMDQTTGMSSNGAEVATALALALFNGECREAVLRCVAEQQNLKAQERRQHEFDLDQQVKAIKDANELQRDLKVTRSSAPCLTFLVF